jgi:hypothetical protein
MLAGTVDDIDRGSFVLDLPAARSLVSAMLDSTPGHSHGGFLDGTTFGFCLRGRNGFDGAACRVAFREVTDAPPFDLVLFVFLVGMGH